MAHVWALSCKLPFTHFGPRCLRLGAPEAQMLKQRAGRFSANKGATGFRYGTLIGLQHYIVICIYEPHVCLRLGAPEAQMLK